MVKANEEAAKIIYEAMYWAQEVYNPGSKTPQWVEGGNSLAQVEARRAAARISEVPKRSLNLAALRDANVERQEEWCPGQKPDLSFRGNELAGEVGEVVDALCAHMIELASKAGHISNIIKKLERARHGWRGSTNTLLELEQELGDPVTTADLTALSAGIEDLGSCVKAKFNDTSLKNNLSALLR